MSEKALAWVKSFTGPKYGLSEEQLVTSVDFVIKHEEINKVSLSWSDLCIFRDEESIASVARNKRRDLDARSGTDNPMYPDPGHYGPTKERGGSDRRRW